MTPKRPNHAESASLARPSPVGAIAQLGQASMTGLELQKLLDLATGLACDVLGVEYAKVLHQPGPGQPLSFVAGLGWNPDVIVGETTVPCDDRSQAGYTLLTDLPVIVEDLSMETRFAGPALLTDHGVRSGISVTIPLPDRAYGIIGAHTKRQRKFTSDDGEFLQAVASFIGNAVINEQARHELDLNASAQQRRIRFQEALAECAQALLANRGRHRLSRAVEVLLSATQATYAFVERNELDPELGLCSRTVIEVEEGDAYDNPINDPYWDLVPWTKMPISRSYMEKGEAFFLIPSELTGPEYEQYANDPYPIQSELNIPIFVDGNWEGLIGFADITGETIWTDEDISLLTTAAAMIGAFWEREASVTRLEDLIVAKDTFLASVSHELRTPLTAVVGFGELLRDSGAHLSDDERRDLLDLVIAQGTDVTNIVSDLLVAAKANIGTLDVEKVTVNLKAQIAQVIVAIHEDERISFSPEDRTVRAVGDPDRIRQVVRNLLTNALRYGGQAIRVELEASGGFAKIRVIDSGEAIAAEDVERIFLPYQRAHDSPGLTGSLGLGLAISRQLAHLMDGALTYRHERNESVFELVLPEDCDPSSTPVLTESPQ